MRPDVLSISRITIIEVVDLPTSPTLSPRAMEKLMPSTARKVSVSTGGLRLKILPREVGMPLRGYSFTSCSTTSKASLAAELDVLRTVLVWSARGCSCSGKSPRSDTPVLHHMALLHHHHAVAIGGR